MTAPTTNEDAELERIIAAGHNGQCNHGAFYMNPTELKSALSHHIARKTVEARIDELRLFNEANPITDDSMAHYYMDRKQTLLDQLHKLDGEQEK
jgi:phosphatidylserine/phosphatidylglycerophosphate/cardiolipin synthase-like enzyme